MRRAARFTHPTLPVLAVAALLAAVLTAMIGVAYVVGFTAPSSAVVNINCNDTSSDATAINNAISRSSSGDQIVFHGVCIVDHTIELRGNRSYRGDSLGTVIEQANGANLQALLASDSWVENSGSTGSPIQIRQLSIDGNAVNNSRTTTDCLVLRSWGSTAEGLHIHDCTGSGIRVTNLTADGTTLDNTQVNGRIAANFIENSGGYGVFVEDTGNSVTDWNLLDNWVANSGEDGIHMDNAAGWVVERNHVYGVQENAIYANRVFASSISDNYIEDFGRTSTPGTYRGIYLKMQGSAASNVVGNRIFNYNGEKNTGSAYHYLDIAVNYGTAQVAVTGNVIRGAGTNRGTGLFYSGALNVASTGNSVRDVGTPRHVGPGATMTAGL